jgi:hypothetical protein
MAFAPVERPREYVRPKAEVSKEATLTRLPGGSILARVMHCNLSTACQQIASRGIGGH